MSKRPGRNTSGRSTAASIAALACSAALAFGAAPALAEKPARLQPTRILSIGDSITTAFDSNFILENPSESWVNGYSNFFTELFGLEDVNSHSQRADAAFGLTSNVLGAVSGARMDDMASQAGAGLASSPYYVTVELGGNDVCRDSIAEVPDFIDYAFDFIDGAAVLDPSLGGGTGGLTPGSTVYVASVPDVKQLYDVGKDQTGVFGLDCETIWLTTVLGFPCGSMLSPLNSESDRLLLQSINAQYNFALEFLVDILNPISQNVYWDFTWSAFNYSIQGDDISSIDCFHPSSQGQRALSEETWADGPFSAF